MQIKAGSVTVNIYRGKSRGYDLFTVVHYQNGQRKRKAFGSLADAKAHADDVAAQISCGQIDVLNLTSADRQSYVNALNLLRPLGMPLHSAIEEYVAARGQLDNESVLSAVKEHVNRRRRVVEKAVSEIVREMLDAKERDGLSRRYIQTLRGHLNRFAGAFQTNIGGVTAWMIDRWLAAQQVGPRARNNIRMSIITLFHFARAQGYLAKGQPTEADDVAKAKDRGGKIGIFAPAVMAKIMKKAAREHALYFALGGFAGLRRAEIERLEWSDFNFARGHITVAAEKSKTATRRLVPIQPNLMQWLAPYCSRGGPLFSSRRLADKAIGAVKKHKIEWPDNVLRHSYGTYRLAAIADAARVSLEMGNSVQKLIQHYREIADEQDAAAWFSICPKRPGNVVAIAA
jgi:integrase